MQKLFANDEERAKHRGWVQTRIPEPMHKWAKSLASNVGLPYGNMVTMYTALMTEFLEKKPWEQGLAWRPAPATRSVSGDSTASTGYVQINIELADTTLNGTAVMGSQFADIVKQTANSLGVSASVFAATAMLYLTAYKHPPVRR